MVLKRIMHILLVLAGLGVLFFVVTSAFKRPPVRTKDYKDPNFSQLYGIADKTEVYKQIHSVTGNDVALTAEIVGNTVFITGRMKTENPEHPHTHESMHKRVIYMPVVIFRKFADVKRVRCVISNKSRNYGLDVTREAFEDYVGLSTNSAANNWESNVVSMLVYDKINRDNFMELYGLYKPAY